LEILDQILANPQAGKNELMFVAQAANQLNQLAKVEKALERLTSINPNNPEAWFDLAGVQAMMNLQTQAVASLGESLRQNAQRRSKDSNSPNLYTNAVVDEKFNAVRLLPEFQRLITQYASLR
jgi:thioredoxin-like negative regulator of GroEL